MTLTAAPAAAVPEGETIDMARAIAIADGKASANGLTDVQKQLVEVVKEERKTEMGRTLTDQAAHNGYTLQAHHGMWGGDADGSTKTVTVKLEQGDHTVLSLEDRQGILHHELVHTGQFIRGTSNPPDGLSSLDQALWYYGMESQAYVASEEDRRQRKGLPPMTDEQKRAYFAEAFADSGYDGHYGVGSASRTDGRRLTEQEFEKAFGSTPGHPGNFLAGGHFTDPINIYDPPGGPVTDPILHRVRAEEEGPFIPYEQLPKSGGSGLRVEGTDQKYVFFLDRKTDGAVDVTLYERDDRIGETGQYVKLGTQHQEITTEPNGKTTASFTVDQPYDSKKINITLTVGSQDHPEVHASVDNGNSQQNYALRKEQHNRASNNKDVANNGIILPPSHEHFVQEHERSVQKHKELAQQRKQEQDMHKAAQALIDAINGALHPPEPKGSDTMERFPSESVREHSAPAPNPAPAPGELRRGI